MSFHLVSISLTPCRALYEPGATLPNGSISDATRTEVLHAVGRFFKPELINRLDELLVFNKLPPSVILDIVSLRLGEVQSRLQTRRISLDVSEEAKIWLASKGYSETFGARAVQRVIRDKVVTRIAGGMLDGTIRSVESRTVGIEPRDLDVRFRDGEIVKIFVVDDDIALSNSPDLGLPVVRENSGHGSDGPEEEAAGPLLLEALDDSTESGDFEGGRRGFG